MTCMICHKEIAEGDLQYDMEIGFVCQDCYDAHEEEINAEDVEAVEAELKVIEKEKQEN